MYKAANVIVMKLAIRIALVIDISASLALPAHGLPSDTSSGTDLRHLLRTLL